MSIEKVRRYDLVRVARNSTGWIDVIQESDTGRYIEYTDVAGLVESMKKILDDAEQSAFEGWLSRVCPSGDAESVHSQWLDSADYDDLGDNWHNARNELARWQS